MACGVKEMFVKAYIVDIVMPINIVYNNINYWDVNSNNVNDKVIVNSSNDRRRWSDNLMSGNRGNMVPLRLPKL